MLIKIEIVCETVLKGCLSLLNNGYKKKENVNPYLEGDFVVLDNREIQTCFFSLCLPICIPLHII